MEIKMEMEVRGMGNGFTVDLHHLSASCGISDFTVLAGGGRILLAGEISVSSGEISVSSGEISVNRYSLGYNDTNKSLSSSLHTDETAGQVVVCCGRYSKYLNSAIAIILIYIVGCEKCHQQPKIQRALTPLLILMHLPFTKNINARVKVVGAYYHPKIFGCTIFWVYPCSKMTVWVVLFCVSDFLNF